MRESDASTREGDDVKRCMLLAAVLLLAGAVVNVAVAAARDGTELASVVSFPVWRVTVAAARR